MDETEWGILMRILGFIAFVVGLLLLLVSCGMDVSVPTLNGHRVNNIGLMHQQSMFAMVGLGLLLLGVVMWIAGRKKPALHQSHGSAVGNLSQEDALDLEALLAGKGRTGIQLQMHNPKVVGAVVPGSPAASAGVLPGDRLIQIAGQFVSDDYRSATMQLAGAHGTDVQVVLRRGDQALDIVIQRELAEEMAGTAIASGHVKPSNPSARTEAIGVWPYMVIFGIGLILLYFRMR